MVLLFIAGIACCVAMAMPQVHIVAYCGDLGYGPARGAEMLSMMLGFGLISRIAGGFIADRIGGVATLLLSSVLQGVALLLYLFFDGLFSLYVISALFGLFQGGIVPMYAIIVREYFAPQEAGTRLGVVLLATLGGMALGGWMSGLIFDLTGSYQAAFLNGLGWNLVNVSIVAWLLFRPGRRLAAGLTRDTIKFDSIGLAETQAAPAIVERRGRPRSRLIDGYPAAREGHGRARCPDRGQQSLYAPADADDADQSRRQVDLRGGRRRRRARRHPQRQSRMS